MSSGGRYQRGGSDVSKSTRARLLSASTSPSSDTRTWRELLRTSIRW
jgi:hypothetical protein